MDKYPDWFAIIIQEAYENCGHASQFDERLIQEIWNKLLDKMNNF
jgi:hypothetical protein